MPGAAPLTVVSRSVLAAWLVLAVEWALISVRWWSQITSGWELKFGTLWLVPTALCVSGLVGTGVGVFLFALGRPTWRVGYTAVAGLCGAALAMGISDGRHFQQDLVRAGFVIAVGVLSAGCAYAFAPLLRWVLEHAPRRTALIAALLSVLTACTNQVVLVRLYPAFHLALAVLTVAFGAIALNAVLGQRTKYTSLAATGVTLLWVGAAITTRPGAERFANFDNLRFLLLEKAPTLGFLVRAASALAPPAPLDAPTTELSATSTPGAAPDLRERDVLLISVDAMRADHVGAYGYGRPTTPHMDQLAREGTRFDRAYCATPHTSYSVVSLMTGKYARPLLRQGVGGDSETIAGLLREYGYHTGAFYPPAVFFIDEARFSSFRESQLGFEYQKVEFAEGQKRIDQVAQFLGKQPEQARVFTWVHLFGPHEPYELHPKHDFGARDLDRYDSEIRAADDTVGALIALARARDPRTVVILTADHGEEFGEHGGRYHGTSVYEEQVRVPLIVSAPGAVDVGVVTQPVQTVDVLPTLLSGLRIPSRPRVRGRDLGPFLLPSGAQAPAGEGFAYSETDDHTLLAERDQRLVCARKIGACKLFDLQRDPTQQTDISNLEPARFLELKTRLRTFSASHGSFEEHGARQEGRGWPAPLLRGLAGEVDAAPEIAVLLDDADVVIRRKSAELLFELKHPESAPGLRLALQRDEDSEVRNWSALALVRLGEGVSLDLLSSASSDRVNWQRLAALALAETGDRRGEALLVDWWTDADSRDFERSEQLLGAFRALKSKRAVWPLIQTLADVRLRPSIAQTLAVIGDEEARGPLALALSTERYQGARVVLAQALLRLGAKEELAAPLVRFLGVPDPLTDGLEVALQAGVLPGVGGPSKKDLERMIRDGTVGAKVRVAIPRGTGGDQLRCLVRARTRDGQAGTVTISRGSVATDNRGASSRVPEVHTEQRLSITVPGGDAFADRFSEVPELLALRPGLSADLVVFASHNVELRAFAIVPMAEELPPPPPKAWKDVADAGLPPSPGK